MNCRGYFKHLTAYALLFFLTLPLSVLGFFLIYGEFAYHDDEGMLIYSLRNFLSHRALYDKISTQFGPAYYMINRFIFSGLNLLPTHNSVRMLSLFLWILGSFIMGLVVYRYTKDLVISLFALCATFMLCSVIVLEPGHPQAMLYLFVGLAVLLSTHLPARWVMVALGLIAGLCFSIKINVGILLLGAIVWIIVSCENGKEGYSTCLRALCAFGLLILPLGLMYQKLKIKSFFLYFIVATSAIINLIIIRPSIGPYRSKDCSGGGEGAKGFILFFCSFLTAVVFSGVFVLLRGTTLRGLYYGVIGQHLRFAEIFWGEPGIEGMGIVTGAVLSVIFCLGYVQAHRQESYFLDRLFLSLSLDKIVLIIGKFLFSGIFIFYLLLRIIQNEIIPRTCFDITCYASYFIPWIWLVILPFPGQEISGGQQLRRYALVSIASLQFLIAYPVTGSQMAFALVLIIPISLINIADGIACLDNSGTLNKRMYTVVREGFYFLLLVCTAFVIYQKACLVSDIYNHNRPSRILEGSSMLRLSEEWLTVREGLVLNAQRNAEALLTMPGMYSFCLWSGIDSPTLLNQTNWPFAFSAAQQRDIVERIGPITKLFVIFNPVGMQFWSKRGLHHAGPLEQYIYDRFKPMVSIREYELCVRKSEIDGFQLIGALWTGLEEAGLSSWIDSEKTGLSETDAELFKRESIALALLRLPVIQERFYRIEVYNLTKRVLLRCMKFSDDTDMVLMDSTVDIADIRQRVEGQSAYADRHGNIRKLNASWLKENGIAMDRPYDIILPLYKGAQDSPEDFYTVRIFDSSGKVIFNLPFVRSLSAGV